MDTGCIADIKAITGWDINTGGLIETRHISRYHYSGNKGVAMGDYT